MNKYDGYILITYDISTTTKKGKITYRKFIKALEAKGYVMGLESFYYKYFENLANSKYDIKYLESLLTDDASVIAIKLTNKDFDNLIYLSGDKLPKLDNRLAIY